MSIQLGDKAKDLVTGFTGICIARTQWLNGCTRIVLQSEKLDKEGKPNDGQTFDEPQLALVKSAVVPAPATNSPARRTGGPIPAPQRHPAAKR